jgi:hypothetical protein
VIRPGGFLGMTISGFGSPVNSTGVQQPDLVGEIPRRVIPRDDDPLSDGHKKGEVVSPK